MFEHNAESFRRTWIRITLIDTKDPDLSEIILRDRTFLGSLLGRGGGRAWSDRGSRCIWSP